MAKAVLQPVLLLALIGTAVALGLREKVPCIDNGKFYRNPNRDPNTVWSTSICSKYHLCIENEIFSFECSTGLNFDIQRQICDFKDKVGIAEVCCMGYFT